MEQGLTSFWKINPNNVYLLVGSLCYFSPFFLFLPPFLNKLTIRAKGLSHTFQIPLFMGTCIHVKRQHKDHLLMGTCKRVKKTTQKIKSQHISKSIVFMLMQTQRSFVNGYLHMS